MKKQLRKVIAVVCALAVPLLLATLACSQEVNEKPPMYSYVGNWDIPRAQWGEMDKANMADLKVLDKAIANGTIVGYGHDVNLVHTADGSTHDEWWSAMSMAGVINVLEQFYQSGTTTSPVLASATKHWDDVYVSRYYNWHSGSWKNVYTHVSTYKLKKDAPDDAVETLSKNLIVPLLEKQLADGTIHEYEVDVQAIHTTSPGTFAIVYIAANAEGLDKVNAAIRDTLKANPLQGPAFGSMEDFSEHRDYLARTNATFK